MHSYKNLSGNSGVVAFDIKDDSLTVQFINGDVYVYSYENPGDTDVEEMKILAENGVGLATYISQNIKDAYERKIT